MFKHIIIVALLCSCSALTFAKDHKILFISSNHSNKAKVSLLKEISEDRDIDVQHKPENTFTDVAEAAGEFAGFDLIVLDAVSRRESKKTYEKYIPAIRGFKGNIIAISDVKEKTLRQGISLSQAQQLQLYWKNGGNANLNRLVDYLSYRLLDTADIAVAAPIDRRAP